jgi:hypothetical protein
MAYETASYTNPLFYSNAYFRPGNVQQLERTVEKRRKKQPRVSDGRIATTGSKK